MEAGGVAVLGPLALVPDPTKVRIVQSAVSPDINGWFGHVYLDAATETRMYVWAVCGKLG